jgi:D-arabinose 1-dehydrogenase-like Zn-dependent alcohol dehydrogenase
MVSPSSHNGRDTQRVQVSYVAHVTPIPENLDSNEAASFLCAVRMSCRFVGSANIDNHVYRVSLYTAR